jgi:hypothetical protein
MGISPRIRRNILVTFVTLSRFVLLISKASRQIARPGFISSRTVASAATLIIEFALLYKRKVAAPEGTATFVLGNYLAT